MDPLVAGGARRRRLRDLAATARVISVVVLTDEQVQASSPSCRAATPGTVIAVHSTIDAATAPAAGRARRSAGSHVLDVALTGGPGGAAEGTLVAMVGGDRAAYERAKPVFETWSSLQLYFGTSGAAFGRRLPATCCSSSGTRRRRDRAARGGGGSRSDQARGRDPAQ